MPSRQRVLAGLVVVTAVCSVLLLWNVVATVFFAVTVAYVLYPLRRFLVGRGASRRVAALTSTLVAILAAAALVVPLVWSIYERRSVLVALLRELPATFVVELYGFTYPIELATYVAVLREALTDLAVGMAQEATVLGLKGFLFVMLVYGLLLRPAAAPTVAFRTVPGSTTTSFATSTSGSATPSTGGTGRVPRGLTPGVKAVSSAKRVPFARCIVQSYRSKRHQPSRCSTFLPRTHHPTDIFVTMIRAVATSLVL